MRKTSSKVKSALALSIFAIGLLAEDNLGDLALNGSFTSQAQAIVGRPLSPVSVAGVARRTTRRMIRRSTIYIATLPPNCVVIQLNGVRSWQCGTTYYQQSGTQYVVVIVDS